MLKIQRSKLVINLFVVTLQVVFSNISIVVGHLIKITPCVEIGLIVVKLNMSDPSYPYSSVSILS